MNWKRDGKLTSRFEMAGKRRCATHSGRTKTPVSKTGVANAAERGQVPCPSVMGFGAGTIQT